MRTLSTLRRPSLVVRRAVCHDAAMRRLGLPTVVLAAATCAMAVSAFVLSASAAPAPLTVQTITVPGAGVVDLTAGPGGMWYSALGPKQIGRVSPAGGVRRFALPIAAVDASAGSNDLVAGPDGNVWVTARTASAWVLVRVRPNGKGTVVDLGMPNQPGKDAVAALGTHKGGPLWFGVWWNRAATITVDGTVASGPGVAEGFPQTAAAIGWAADRTGAMWFVYGRGYGRIRGGTVSTWEPADGHKHEFRDIALGPDGNMWVADNNNAERLGVGRISPTGALREFRVPGGPWSITVGPDRNLWVSLPYSGVARVTPKGMVTTYTGVGPNPSSIASGFGKLWLVTANAGAIARIDVPKR